MNRFYALIITYYLLFMFINTAYYYDLPAVQLHHTPGRERKTPRAVVEALPLAGAVLVGY
jgi:hypothetical protein